MESLPAADYARGSMFRFMRTFDLIIRLKWALSELHLQELYKGFYDIKGKTLAITAMMLLHFLLNLPLNDIEKKLISYRVILHNVKITYM